MITVDDGISGLNAYSNIECNFKLRKFCFTKKLFFSFVLPGGQIRAKQHHSLCTEALMQGL